MNKEKIRQFLQAFDFERLFNELGWERASLNHSVRIKEKNFSLRAVAEKRSFAVFVCPELPDYATRVKIESEVTKSFRENLLIFYNPEKTEQRWLWSKREVGKPIARRERAFQKGEGQSGEPILQALQGIEFTLEEEEGITFTDVSSRIRANFDLERVTKRFYDRFKREHDVFMGFIQGIPDEDLQAWYASVMLNRLMFIYFIQNKNFLNNDPRYLQNHLAQSQGNFYREFLIPLFFDGFSSQHKSKEIRALLGDVPYLNGGIFMPHSIELEFGDSLNIPDLAFEKIFAFFEGYRWHLDERALKRDDEINPDVLGYIFEKYINQKQMGAYYTKEDITEYISKNTIIPFLFDQAQKDVAVAFKGDYSVWRIAQDAPDRYIYEAVRKGTELELPQGIAKGLDDVSQRDQWNSPTSPEYGLPTEIWRETVARRQRYAEVKGKLERGEVRSINDFITYNLDMRQFAQDVIQNAESSDLIKAFWNAITTVTVLDPTCGSGAFLFAALNILEPLYEACLERMDAFLREPERGKRYAEFEAIQAQIDQHPNEKYFIYKRIILNNLYGVDIMEEAIEICKLRLFLKLVAQEDDPKKIEPLPDIDFNIRAGNTLVGFATKAEIDPPLSQGFRLYNPKEVLAQLETLTGSLTTFREQQLTGSVNSQDMKDIKKRINTIKTAMIETLDDALMQEYGLKDLASFRRTHKPFHWYAEFYSVLANGGFDVIIGNPPYVEYSKVKKEYQIQGYETEQSGNLYAFALERSVNLLSNSSWFGMIVPMSFVSTDRTNTVRKYLITKTQNLIVSNYSGDAHPSVLFDGVKMRLSIVFGNTTSEAIGGSVIYASRFNRWYAEARGSLFTTLDYQFIPKELLQNGLIPKLGRDIESSILQKIYEQKKTIGHSVLRDTTVNSVYAHRIVTHFVKCFDFIPHFWNEKDGLKKSEDYKVFAFRTHSEAVTTAAILNSTIFYIFYLAYSDAYHCGRELILSFPTDISSISPQISNPLDMLISKLMNNMKANSKRRKIEYRTGWIEYDEFYPRLSKPIIDEIDRILAQHYGFTDEELDFIINYDIKYRMGDELGGDDEDDGGE